jgi:hypothetical protein
LDLHFNIILNTVNNTKGILGLKRGKELWHSQYLQVFIQKKQM